MTGPATGDQRPLPPRLTANPAPPRRPGSVRRTTSIDVEWTDGPEGDRILHGRARDVLTPAAGETAVLDEAWMTAGVDPERTITALAASPTSEPLAGLVGQRGGGHLRVAMTRLIPELIASAAPLYLLLDDISGTSLISTWAWWVWHPEWLEQRRQELTGDQMDQYRTSRANVCWGFKPGHSSMDVERPAELPGATEGGELRNPADPDGWHEFPALSGVSMRRARRIEVWRDGGSGLFHVESAFQDSAPRPDGTRAALHEYGLSATLDPDGLRLLTLTIEPRVLPFHECPGAMANAMKLVGTPLPEIRDAVLDQLRGPAGCTHLNDALRALGEVPELLRRLPG